jgi:branched-subunit amino acid transport protein
MAPEGCAMSSGGYVLLVIGMGLVTYLPRWLPLQFLADRRLPDWFADWLEFVPAAILAALLAPLLFMPPDKSSLDLLQPRLLVAVPTFIFALRTRSLAGTMFVGMLLYWLAGRLLA